MTPPGGDSIKSVSESILENEEQPSKLFSPPTKPLSPLEQQQLDPPTFQNDSLLLVAALKNDDLDDLYGIDKNVWYEESDNDEMDDDDDDAWEVDSSRCPTPNTGDFHPPPPPTSATCKTTTNTTTTQRRSSGRGGDGIAQRVQRVSQQAALVGKRKIWDTNDMSIHAAQQAVDQWETLYWFCRSFVVTTATSVSSCYGATKAALGGMEHALVVPLRDWILWPTLTTAEHAVGWVGRVVTSPQVASVCLQTVHAVPLLGPTVLEPTLVLTGQSVQSMYNIVQYPIPSRATVRTTVDGALTATKWALVTAVSEVASYVQRLDAMLTRQTLLWRIADEAFYHDLDVDNQHHVLTHMEERYHSLGGGESGEERHVVVAQYEFLRHLQSQNAILYQDLIQQLRVHSRQLQQQQQRDDVWLSPRPVYHSIEGKLLLDSTLRHDNSDEEEEEAMWFYLPRVNGERPSKDVAWVPFSPVDSHELEEGYRLALAGAIAMTTMSEPWKEDDDRTITTTATNNDNHVAVPRDVDLDVEEQPLMNGGGNLSRDGTISSMDEAAARLKLELRDLQNHVFQVEHDLLHEDLDKKVQEEEEEEEDEEEEQGEEQKDTYPTIAKWYEPDVSKDVFVDQSRHAVSFVSLAPLRKSPPQDPRRKSSLSTSASVSARTVERSEMGPPPEERHDLLCDLAPFQMIMRPTLWRFYGPGNDVRRGVWLLDTSGGLQPYDEEAAAILEDAYLFLKWRCHHQRRDDDDDNEEQEMEGALLTVQVTSPDGMEQQLVQFRSLTHVTAISKTFGGAIALFQRRVYRGVKRQRRRRRRQELRPHPPPPPPTESHESNNCKPKDETAAPDQRNGSEVHSGEGEGEETNQTGSRPKASVVEYEVVDETREDSHVSSREDADSGRAAGSPRPQSAALLQTAMTTTTAVPSLAAVEDPETSSMWGSTTMTTGAEQVDHLVLVVHGIGEMLRSIDLFGLALPPLSSIVDCCAWLRQNHSQVLGAQLSSSSSSSSSSTRTGGRVEYIPIEWHEAFAIYSKRKAEEQRGSGGGGGCGVRQNKATSLNDISLRTIPGLRAFANDSMLDVLYFMSPEHHQVIVDIVTTELNRVVGKFKQLTNFDGQVSVVAHSLGSVVMWDILDHQVSVRSDAKAKVGSIEEEVATIIDSPAPQEIRRECEAGTSANITATVSTTRFPQLDFAVSNTFLLGSPVAVFLMIRNQHRPLSEDFYLRGCRRVFNLFHPYDPVSYRIEPLIDGRNAKVAAKLVTHWKGGLRVQYQTKYLWKKLISETLKTQRVVIDAFEAGMAGIGLFDMTVDDLLEEEEEEDDAGGVNGNGGGYEGATTTTTTTTPGMSNGSISISSRPRPPQQQARSAPSRSATRSHVVRCGRLNQGRRIDYMLQEKEIENASEYVSALAAHSSYWNEKDVSLFIARQLVRAQREEMMKSGEEGAEAEEAARVVRRKSKSRNGLTNNPTRGGGLWNASLKSLVDSNRHQLHN